MTSYACRSEGKGEAKAKTSTKALRAGTPHHFPTSKGMRNLTSQTRESDVGMPVGLSRLEKWKNLR